MAPAHFATRWTIDHADVTSAIAGPRTAPQWTDYLRAVEQRLDEEDDAFVSAVVAPRTAFDARIHGAVGRAAPSAKRHPVTG